MKTFRQLAADLWKQTIEDPERTKDVIRDIVPLAPDNEIDRLAQQLRAAAHATTKKEREAILKEYRAGLEKFAQ